MSHHFSSLPTAMLRGYHSFTRAPRAQLWARFALSQGAQVRRGGKAAQEAFFVVLLHGRCYRSPSCAPTDPWLHPEPASMPFLNHNSCRCPLSLPQSGEEHLLGHGCGPLHVQMTRFLLEYVLASFPTAALLVYTIAVPQWLSAWCARWGHPGGTMRVVALLAHEQDAAGQSAAPRALYIPCAAA